jgi:hypothetical protein
MDAPSPMWTPVAAAFQRHVGVDSAGVLVVGQHHGWSDEHPVAEHRRLVDEGVVLELAVVAHDDAGSDVRAASDHTA